jgi:hypothetical protein
LSLQCWRLPLLPLVLLPLVLLPLVLLSLQPLPPT